MAEESKAVSNNGVSIDELDAVIAELAKNIEQEGAEKGVTWWDPDKKQKPTGRFGERASDYRTQKARGVHGIKRQAFYHLQSRFGMVGKFPEVLYTLPHDGMDLCKSLFAGSYPRAYFARPCPTVPRHGFVESRIVENREDLEHLIQQTLKEDPNGEVLIMPVLAGAFSAVANNAGISWGFGNDGVTGGFYNVHIPCPVAVEAWRDAINRFDSYGGKFYDNYDADFNETVPYIELVEHNDSIVPVQVRAGPPMTVCKNYVPVETTVEAVLTPNIHSQNTTALLAWEKTVKDALKANKGPKGLVVWGPGMALSSHWAIHAVQHEIAVWTEKSKPNVGQVLPVQTEAVEPLCSASYQKIAEYIEQAQQYSISEFDARDVIITAMSASHALSFWGPDKHLLRLRACAVEFITRFVAAACIGEARHFYNCGPGRQDNFSDFHDVSDFESREEYEEAKERWENGPRERESNLPWKEIFGKKNKREGIERSQVYLKMLTPYGLSERSHLVDLCAKDFRMPGWGSEDSDTDPDHSHCSYGGPRWARVCDAVLALIAATTEFQLKPNRSRWDKLVARVNYAAHVAHNGGGVLGKWIRNEALNCIAVKPTYGFMNYFAAHIALNGFRAKHPEE